MPLVFADETPIKKPKVGRPKKKLAGGRPSTDKRHDSFMQVTEYISQHDDEQTTLPDLVTKMAEYLEDSGEEPYGEKHLKQKLIDHFGDKIMISTINGITNVVTLRHTAESILVDFHKRRCDDPTTEKSRIIETAAKL